MKDTFATRCFSCDALVLFFRGKRAPKCPRCYMPLDERSNDQDVVIDNRDDYFPPKLKEDPNQQYLPGFERTTWEKT